MRTRADGDEPLASARCRRRVGRRRGESCAARRATRAAGISRRAGGHHRGRARRPARARPWRAKRDLDFMYFHRYAANAPRAADGLWAYAQMVRWGLLEPSERAATAAADIFHPGLYRQSVPRRSPTVARASRRSIASSSCRRTCRRICSSSPCTRRSPPRTRSELPVCTASQRAGVPLNHRGARCVWSRARAAPRVAKKSRLRSDSYDRSAPRATRWHGVCIERRNDESSVGLDQQRRWSVSEIARPLSAAFFCATIHKGDRTWVP